MIPTVSAVMIATTSAIYYDCYCQCYYDCYYQCYYDCYQYQCYKNCYIYVLYQCFTTNATQEENATNTVKTFDTNDRLMEEDKKTSIITQEEDTSHNYTHFQNYKPSLRDFILVLRCRDMGNRGCYINPLEWSQQSQQHQ